MGAGLQPGLLKKSGKLQQCLWRATRIKAEGQALDWLLSGHPEGNGESSKLELAFDMRTADESCREADDRLDEIEYRTN